MSIAPQQMEMFAASQSAERLGGSDRLMEMILKRYNTTMAWKRVRANKGAAGADGMTTGQLGKYLGKYWPKIEKDLLNGTHKPLPVKRKEIPKPDGGVRLLGIPTVLDRFIQQAISQIVEQIWDPTFSEFSYGFRPGKSAHGAVMQGKRYMQGGYTYVVDMDLSKFFDHVNHDKLVKSRIPMAKKKAPPIS